MDEWFLSIQSILWLVFGESSSLNSVCGFWGEFRNDYGVSEFDSRV